MIKKILNEEHEGFAMTFEVICTLAIMCSFLNFTLYFMRVMNVQRYMNTVLTSTAQIAARWGGPNSNAYKQNVDPNESLIAKSQKQLNFVANYPGGYGAVIKCDINGDPSAEKIQDDGDVITITIDYHLPEFFKSMSVVNPTTTGENYYDMYDKTQNMNMKVSVQSIMKAGVLL